MHREDPRRDQPLNLHHIPKRIPIAVALLLLLICGGVLAEDPKPAEPPMKLEEHPGFIDFGTFGEFSEEQLEIHISVQELALRLVAAATRGSDPDLAEMLGGLKLIEVWVYNVDDKSRKTFKERVADIAAELEKKSWQQAMTLRSKGSRGYMYLKLADDIPQGLAVSFISEEDQAIFVNIVGTIDPSQIGRLAEKFNLDMLEGAADSGG